MGIICTERTSCRSCGSSNLGGVLNLGDHHLNGFPLPSEPSTEKAPLELMLCGNCHLAQLRHTVEPDLLYKNFYYLSSVTFTMREALKDVVRGVKERMVLRRGDTIVDIGSNDSTLLSEWGPDLDRIGFEPAENLMDLARQPGLTIVNDYFSYRGLRSVSGKKARAITVIACYYDIDNLPRFNIQLRESIADDGVLVIQQAYLPDMLRNNDISNICHEHLTYQSLLSLEPMLQKDGLHIFDVEQNDINGGSFRIYASPKKREESSAVRLMRMKEHALGLDLPTPYKNFEQRSRILRGQVREYVFNEQKEGRAVYALGASTKGNTLLQFWDLDRKCIQGASDRDPRKHGREMVAGRIPIVSEAEARISASSFLLLPFYFRKEILEREAEFIERGGKVIVPLPQFEEVSNEAV